MENEGIQFKINVRKIPDRMKIIVSASKKDTGISGQSNAGNILKGRGLLVLVAILYGTLNVSLRFVYQLPSPPSASALSAVRGWMGSFCFVPLLALQQSKISHSSERKQNMTFRFDKEMFWQAFELACWNFLAQGLLNIGLLSTGSARASFLTQTSVVLTPIISLMMGQSISPNVWYGCSLAIFGLALLSGSADALMEFSKGDVLVLGGAFAWSFYLLRLSKIGPKFNEIHLQGMKTFILAVFYSLWLTVSIWTDPLNTSWDWTGSIFIWSSLFYSALAPGMMADVLQQQGQRYVSASEGKKNV